MDEGRSLVFSFEFGSKMDCRPSSSAVEIQVEDMYFMDFLLFEYVCRNLLSFAKRLDLVGYFILSSPVLPV